MSTTTRSILVSGATGQQGSAVIRALLSNPPPFDHKILALTRNTTSAKAKKLLGNGNGKVELVQGDLDDCDAIFTTLGKDAVWGVFLVTVPDMSSSTEDAEERQGKAMIDSALKYGVSHLVFSSVDRGGERSESNPTNIKHFVSKHNIEVYLREKAGVEAGKRMGYTILRPVAFMENMVPGVFCKVFNAMWLGMRDTKLQLVSVKDIGVFAAMAFAKSDDAQWKNQAISLAGDELSQEEGNGVFWKVFGRPMPRTYVFVGSVLKSMVKEVGIMFRWFEEEGYGASVEGCRRLNPGMLDLETWFREESGHLR
jgi:uncharacterized protein YbjT (DUF2867 family)